jgi:hypothetical protein
MTTATEPTQADTPRRSRRALLAGGVGGFAMGIAALLGRANPVAAAAGDPIRMGQFNRAGSTMTTLQAKHSQPALRVVQNGAAAAVYGLAQGGGSGVLGSSEIGYGVSGYSLDSSAVRGLAEGFAPAVSGECQFGDGIYGFTDTEAGVHGFSLFGKGVFGESNGGYAGYFAGKTRVDVLDMPESTPGLPPDGQARLFARDNGSGKTQLCVQFATGSPIVLATEA